MPLFLPEFFEENYIKGKLKGSFNGAVVISDISGFTSIAEELIKHGERGIEALTEIVNITFSPAIEIVHSYDGWISHFAGDAFTAVFNDNDNAVCASEDISRKLSAVKADTLSGRKVLRTRTSTGKGDIHWHILESEKAFYTIWGDALINALAGNDAYNTHNNSSQCMKKSPLKDAYRNRIADRFFPERIIQNGMSGEFRNITAMFISVQSADLRDIPVKCADIIIKNGGYFNKLENGDKGAVIFGIFGAPVSYRDIQERAVRCALSILELSNSVTPVRIGMCSGNAYAGYIGNHIRGEYTAIGETVNRASRIMSAADMHEIWVDKSMNNGLFSSESTGIIRMKGYKKGIELFRLTGNTNVQNRFISYRSSENAYINELYERTMLNGKSVTLNIHGNAGSGKSALIRDFIDNHSINAAFVNCDYPVKEPLRPLMEMIRHNNLDKPDQFNEEHRPMMQMLFKSYSVMAGIESTKSVEDPKLLYSNTVEYIFQALCLSNFSMLVFDDAHMLENDSSMVLKKLAAECRTVKLICIVTDSAVDWGKNKTHEIGPLSDSDLMSLCAGIMGRHISPDILNFIKSKTGSYPLYAYKAAEALLPKLIVNDEGLLIMPENSEEIHLDLNSIIISELDRMPIERAGILKSASVIGNHFNIRILKQVYSGRISYDDIEMLCSQNLIYRENVDQYAFKHGVIRDSIYKLQLNREREAAHAKCAKALMKDKHRRLNTAYIAYHYDMAGSKDMALKYYLKAADEELKKYLNTSAYRHYKRVLELSGKEHYASVYCRMAVIDEIRGDWDNAFSDYNNAMRYVKYSNDAEARAKIYAGRGALKWTGSDYDSAMRDLRKALAIYTASGNKKEAAYVRGKIGNVHWKKGAYKKALTMHKIQMRICRSIESRECISSALGSIAALEYGMGNYDTAIGMYKEQLRLNRTSGKILNKAIIYGNLGNIALQRGQYKEAEQYNMRRLKLAEQMGDRMRIAISMGTLGNICRFQNRFDTALMFYEQALNEFRNMKHRHAESITIGNMGICYRRTGDYKNAMKYYEMHYSSAEELNDIEGMQRAVGNMGNVLHRQGEFDTALEKINVQLKLAKRTNDMHHTAVALGNKAHVLRDKGEINDALALYKKAIALCRKLSIKPFLGANLVEMSGLYIAENRIKEAMKCITEVKALAMELNDSEMLYESDIMNIQTLGPEMAAAMLKDMLKEYDDEIKKAEILYFLFTICSDKSAGRRARNAYCKLLKRTDDFLYRNRLELLDNSL